MYVRECLCCHERITKKTVSFEECYDTHYKRMHDINSHITHIFLRTPNRLMSSAPAGAGGGRGCIDMYLILRCLSFSSDDARGVSPRVWRWPLQGVTLPDGLLHPHHSLPPHVVTDLLLSRLLVSDTLYVFK